MVSELRNGLMDQFSRATLCSVISRGMDDFSGRMVVRMKVTLLIMSSMVMGRISGATDGAMSVTGLIIGRMEWVTLPGPTDQATTGSTSTTFGMVKGCSSGQTAKFIQVGGRMVSTMATGSLATHTKAIQLASGLLESE
jgi:hypothetical protein